MALTPTVAQADTADIIGVRSITNRDQVYSILTSVQKARSPITIRFENNDRYYTSLILKTDLDEGYLLIDEVAPEDGHLRALQHQPFSIRGSHKGVSLFFRPNVIIGSGVQDGIAFYKLPLPAEMIYQQRRTAFRALVARALNVRVKLTSTQRNETLDGRLYDISVSGCRVNFEGEIKPEFIRGDYFENCQITLLDGFEITAPVTLKHATFVRDWQETTCGFQLEMLNPVATKAIDRFVYFLQREARRLETK
jgi:c-di-GMP-binding flagellar brake protein YcgR